MANGGRREGAGRKPGQKGKATIERELRAAHGLQSAVEGGLLPLDVILARMRGIALSDGNHPTDDQYKAAVDAAPYLHPRLASTDTTVKSDNIHRVVSDTPMTEDDWAGAYGVPANDAVVPIGNEDDESAAGQH